MYSVEGVLQNRVLVWMSVTCSDGRERKNRNMEQKVRNDKKKLEIKNVKKGAAIVFNQPELVRDQPGRSNRNETVDVSFPEWSSLDRLCQLQLYPGTNFSVRSPSLMSDQYYHPAGILGFHGVFFFLSSQH